jgi:hypothetical protein
MTPKGSRDGGLGLDRPGCTLPTFAGGLVGFLLGGHLGMKNDQAATEKAVQEQGFADFVPVLVPAFAVMGALIGLFVAILLVIAWRLVTRLLKAETKD